MKWQGRQQSSNVEDRRSGGGGGRLPMKGMAGGGIVTIIVVVIALLLGENPLKYLDLGQTETLQQNIQPGSNSVYDEEAEFVAVVLKDTEDIWSQLFQQNGLTYRAPTLVLFSGTDQSGCGTASAAVGPFYCSADEKVYIDLSFAQVLRQRLGADGDFALAYVIAHEVGHHVQHLLGTLEKVNQAERNTSKTNANALSVRLELQADFYAGIWAHYAQATKGVLEPGDVEEAMNAARAVGDDKLQMEAQGYTVPESFTHGTSEQRKSWFMKGFESGDLNLGNTFQ